jgi:hypothetical protein
MIDSSSYLPINRVKMMQKISPNRAFCWCPPHAKLRQSKMKEDDRHKDER